MKYKISSFLQHTISLALIAGLIYYLYSHWDVFKAAADISWLHILVLIFLVLLSWMINAFQVLLLFRMERIPVSFRETLLVQTASLLANYLPMRAGSVLRFYYFKKIHDIEYSRMGGFTALRLLILVAASGMVGCIGLAGLGHNDRPGQFLLWALFIGMFCIPVIAWFIPVHRAQLPDSRLGRLFNKFLSGFVTIRKQPRLAAFIFLLILCQFLILSLRLFISFDAIQMHLSPWLLMLFASIASIIKFLNLTPGNLGLRELMIGFMSLAVGYQFDSAIFAGTFDRVIMMGCTFTLGPIASWLVWSRLEGNSKKQAESVIDG